MKKILLLMLPLMFLGVGVSFSDMPSDGMVTANSESKTINISSTTSSPTQILSDNQFIQRTWLVNLSSNPVMISTFSHTFVFGSEMEIPGSTVFSPDGPQVPYWGPLFAVQTATSTALPTSNSISVMRFK